MNRSTALTDTSLLVRWHQHEPPKRYSTNDRPATYTARHRREPTAVAVVKIPEQVAAPLTDTRVGLDVRAVDEARTVALRPAVPETVRAELLLPGGQRLDVPDEVPTTVLTRVLDGLRRLVTR